MSKPLRSRQHELTQIRQQCRSKTRRVWGLAGCFKGRGKHDEKRAYAVPTEKKYILRRQAKHGRYLRPSLADSKIFYLILFLPVPLSLGHVQRCLVPFQLPVTWHTHVMASFQARCRCFGFPSPLPPSSRVSTARRRAPACQRHLPGEVGGERIRSADILKWLGRHDCV